jgi:hypothetical protein
MKAGDAIQEYTATHRPKRLLKYQEELQEMMLVLLAQIVDLMEES